MQAHVVNSHLHPIFGCRVCMDSVSLAAYGWFMLRGLHQVCWSEGETQVSVFEM